ncbi:MAG TPA: FAD-binding oxidoreductase [Xanthomonadales bacterium]|nr:FAD-binding oxidoreductase [Xanthomonadales bacterium]
MIHDAHGWWLAEAGAVAPAPPLRGDERADVVIVGGGYAGLCTALSLQDRGTKDIAILEAEQVGHGASGRNGGFVFAGYSLGEASLLKQLGPERAKRVYRATVDAVNLVRERVRGNAIECDLVDQGVLWCNWFRDDEVLLARQRLVADTYGEQWHFLSGPEIRALLGTDRYHAALHEPNAFHLHPLDYANGLARVVAGQGARIHERSRVTKLARDGAGWKLALDGATVRAEHVVLCCGGYLAGLRHDIDRSVLPIATYVMATAPLGERMDEVFEGTQAAVYDTRFAFDYYRPLRDTRLLWGGRISILDRAPASVATLLKRDMLKVYPQLHDVEIEYAWSGLMSYARHEMPQLRRLDAGLWCAQAFGGHGLATTTVGGETIARAIHGDTAMLDDVASFGLPSAHKPAGYLAAQATYSWLQYQDARRERL